MIGRPPPPRRRPTGRRAEGNGPEVSVESAESVIRVLQLLLNLGPLALYFLVLGFINSQRRPRLVSSRTDFLSLTVVFLPLLIWPLPFLVTHGWWWALIGSAVLVATAFVSLLPRPYDGWVVYHVTEEEFRAIAARSARQIGWTVHVEGTDIVIPEPGLRLRISAFPWLGSVSVQVRAVHGRLDVESFRALQTRIERRLARRSLLPSAVGTCLVLVGVTLAIIPLWTMLRHMDAIVEVVRNLLV